MPSPSISSRSMKLTKRLIVRTMRKRNMILGLALLVGTTVETASQYVDPSNQHKTPPKRGATIDRMRLVHHSFGEDGKVQDLLHWDLSSATVPISGDLLLNPATMNRHGWAWNTEALTTTDFEVEFTVKTDAENRPPAGQGSGFGFFVTSEDQTLHLKNRFIVSKSETDWNQGVLALGNTFIGMDPSKKGFGLVFLLQDEKKNMMPNLSCVQLPRVGMVAGQNYPVQATTKFDFRNQPIDVKVRVSKNIVVASYKAANTTVPWQEACKVMDYQVNPRSFFGFTSFTGSAEGVTKGDYSVRIGKLQTWNYDVSALGEELSGIAADIKTHYERLHKKKFIFNTQKEQTEALHDVLGMLKGYLSGQKTTEEKVNRSLLKMKAQVMDMETSAMKLKTEMKVILADKGSPEKRKEEVMNELKTHVSSIRSLIHTNHGDENLAEATRMLARGGDRSKYENMVRQSEEIKKLASANSSHMFWLNAFIICAIAGVIVAVAKKIYSYERTHML